MVFYKKIIAAFEISKREPATANNIILKELSLLKERIGQSNEISKSDAYGLLLLLEYELESNGVKFLEPGIITDFCELEIGIPGL